MLLCLSSVGYRQPCCCVYQQWATDSHVVVFIISGLQTAMLLCLSSVGYRQPCCCVYHHVVVESCCSGSMVGHVVMLSTCGLQTAHLVGYRQHILLCGGVPFQIPGRICG